MGSRVVVIGGDAAGMTVASAVRRRLGEDDEVVVLERGTWTSYSACGIPYWVGGVVDDVDRLVARTPEQHRANGIDLRMRSEAVALDLDRREVEVRDHSAGRTYRLGFDDLVLATGARPRRPEVPGIDADGVHGVQTLDDGEALLDGLAGELCTKQSAIVLQPMGGAVARDLHQTALLPAQCGQSGRTHDMAAVAR